MTYKAALCKAAWGKKLLAQVAERTSFCPKNCDSNFFMGWQIILLNQKKMVIRLVKEINEMKQTKNWL